MDINTLYQRVAQHNELGKDAVVKFLNYHLTTRDLQREFLALVKKPSKASSDLLREVTTHHALEHLRNNELLWYYTGAAASMVFAAQARSIYWNIHPGEGIPVTSSGSNQKLIESLYKSSRKEMDFENYSQMIVETAQQAPTVSKFIKKVNGHGMNYNTHSVGRFSYLTGLATEIAHTAANKINDRELALKLFGALVQTRQFNIQFKKTFVDDVTYLFQIAIKENTQSNDIRKIRSQLIDAAEKIKNLQGSGSKR